MDRRHDLRSSGTLRGVPYISRSRESARSGLRSVRPRGHAAASARASGARRAIDSELRYVNRACIYMYLHILDRALALLLSPRRVRKLDERGTGEAARFFRTLALVERSGEHSLRVVKSLLSISFSFSVYR